MNSRKFRPAIQMAVVTSALIATVPLTMAQTADPATKPSPYVGVSQPPPDDTIVSSPDTVPAAPRSYFVGQRPPSGQPLPESQRGQHTFAATASNPDANIVTTPVSENYQEQASATLQQRTADPDAGIVTFVPSRPGELPEGTNIHVRIAQQLSSSETRRGAAFSGQVAQDVMLDGRVVIPEGSELQGRVESVSEGHRFGYAATIRLRPDAIVLPDGSKYALHAMVIGTKGHNAKVDGEGGITPKSRFKKNTIEEGIGAGTGAVTGAAIAGGPGALVGSIVGAGVVTTHLLIQPPQSVDLPSNTTIVLSLTEPLALTPFQN